MEGGACERRGERGAGERRRAWGWRERMAKQGGRERPAWRLYRARPWHSVAQRRGAGMSGARRQSESGPSGAELGERRVASGSPACVVVMGHRGDGQHVAPDAGMQCYTGRHSSRYGEGDGQWRW